VTLNHYTITSSQRYLQLRDTLSRGINAPMSVFVFRIGGLLERAVFGGVGARCSHRQSCAHQLLQGPKSWLKGNVLKHIAIRKTCFHENVNEGSTPQCSAVPHPRGSPCAHRHCDAITTYKTLPDTVNLQLAFELGIVQIPCRRSTLLAD
jgi:hypothetical protein